MSKTDRDTLALVSALGRHVGFTNDITSTARELVIAANQYSRIQERWCSDEMSDETTARLERREERLEERIRSLVQDLPAVRDEEWDGPWSVVFEGDPRGHVVKLIHPDGSTIGVDQ